MGSKDKGEQELKAKIVDDLRKRGFPLEIHVIESCLGAGFLVDPNVHYRVDGADREIDVYANFSTTGRLKNDTAQLTNSRMIIECKKTTIPWVFFSSSVHKSENMSLYLAMRSDLQGQLKERSVQSLLGRLYDERYHHYGDIRIPRCISYVEAPRNTEKHKRSKRSSIFDSVESVLTFLTTRLADRHPYNENLGTMTDLFYPLIVVEGDLFEAIVDGNDIDIHRRDHILFVNNRYDYLIIIDVVTRNYLADYLKVIIRNHTDTVRIIESINL